MSDCRPFESPLDGREEYPVGGGPRVQGERVEAWVSVAGHMSPCAGMELPGIVGYIPIDHSDCGSAAAPRRHSTMKVSDILRVKGNTLYTATPDEPLSGAVAVMAEPQSKGARRQRSSQQTGSAISALLAVVVVLLVNYLAFRQYERLDWTSQSIFTLSEKSKKVLHGLKRDIDVYLFLSQGDTTQKALALRSSRPYATIAGSSVQAADVVLTSWSSTARRA